MSGYPLLPVYARELQRRAPGAKVEAFDAHGHLVTHEVGELVVTEPMPSMPLYLWNDPDGTRYRDSHFTRYPACGAMETGSPYRAQHGDHHRAL